MKKKHHKLEYIKEEIFTSQLSSQFPGKMNLDDWSVREKLVLACCVVRSGDQNW